MRLLFTLGNLTAKMDEARQQLFQCEGSMLILLRLYHAYQRRGDLAPAASAEADDVLVKLVRVLANMSIHRSVGPALASDCDCIQLLMETLGEEKTSEPAARCWRILCPSKVKNSTLMSSMYSECFTTSLVLGRRRESG